MTPRIYRVLAAFLESVGSNPNGVAEVGEFGPEVAYTPVERQTIGPAVKQLERDRLIVSADAVPSSRLHRNGSIVRRWRALYPEACLERADEFRRRAGLLAGEVEQASASQQLWLF